MPPDDLAAFYAQQFYPLVAYARRFDRTNPEDLVQEAFCAAQPQWSKIRHRALPWFRRVISNKGISTQRSAEAKYRAISRLDNRPYHLDCDNSRFAPSDDEVREAVLRLPARQSACIALFYYDDASISQIASILEISEGTVKANLHNGRAKLAMMLG